MNFSVATTFVLIVLARVADMTLDTLRMASIVQGRRAFAAALGFVQSVICILAIAKVLSNMDHPIYALAYGGGARPPTVGAPGSVITEFGRFGISSRGFCALMRP